MLAFCISSSRTVDQRATKPSHSNRSRVRPCLIVMSQDYAVRAAVHVPFALSSRNAARWPLALLGSRGFPPPPASLWGLVRSRGPTAPQNPTATPMLRADPSYPTVALFHVSLTLRKILKRRAAETVADESVRVPPRVAHRSHPSINSLWPH